MSDDSTPLSDSTALKTPTPTSQNDLSTSEFVKIQNSEAIVSGSTTSPSSTADAHDVITVVRDPNHPLGKSFVVASDGSPGKSSNVKLSFGFAIQHHVPTAASLKKVLEDVGNDPNAAIINSRFTDIPIGEPFVILSRKEMDKRLGVSASDRDQQAGVHQIVVDGKTLKAVCRLKENMRLSSWVLVDRDNDEHTPEKFKQLDRNEFLACLDSLIPGIKNTTLVIAPSSSARVTKDGQPVSVGNGHVYIKVVDPEDIDRLRKIIIARAIEVGMAWEKHRYSKTEPGKVVGKSWATLIDHSVWNRARLIFCGKPTVAEGLVVDPLSIELRVGVRIAVDTASIATPDVDRVKKLSREAGTELSISVSNGVISNAANDLKLDTELETQDFGILTVRDLLKRDVAGKVRCQAPFRDSTSWAAFFNVNDQGIPYAHDSGTSVTHWLNPFERDAIKITEVPAVVGQPIVELEDDGAAALEKEAVGATLENAGNSKFDQAPPIKKPDVIPIISGKESPTAADERGESVILAAKKSLDPQTFPMPPKSENSSYIVSTLPNLKYLLQQFRIVVRYNVVMKTNEVLIPDHQGSDENIENTALSYIRSLAVQHHMSPTMVAEYLEAIGDSNHYNPIAKWIKSMPWDGVNRLPDICNTLQTSARFPQELKDTCIQKWLLSAVAAALSNNEFSTRGVLTLQGGQGIGKSRWIKSLINNEALSNSLIVLGHHLDPSNKDSVMIAIRNWICEIGELDGSFRKDIALMKGFLTNPSDRIRRPYARLDNNYKRRTVFAASVNDEQFLVDTTGNTRFLTLPLEKINWDHGIDMQQVFAQLEVEFNNGKKWWLTDEEQSALEEMNKEHRTINAIRELVLDAIDFDRVGAEGLDPFTPTELLQRLEVKGVKNSDTRDCGAVLREVIGDPKRINGRDRWRVPLKAEDFTEVTKCGTPTVTVEKAEATTITVPRSCPEGTDQGEEESAAPSASPDGEVIF